MRATDELLGEVMRCSQVVSVKRRREIERELRAHIEDFATEAREAGHQESEIDRLLMTRFGDPKRVAEGFAWVYRHERRRVLFVSYVVSTVMVASSLLFVILVIQAGLAVGFGTPVMEMFASRHTVIEGLDMLACVAVYLGVISLETHFEDYRFLKAALLVTALLVALKAGCIAMHLHAPFLFYGLIAGIFLRAVQMFVLQKTVRAMMVPICFACAGLTFAVLRSPISVAEAVATCVSWLAVGAGYLAMTEVAPNVDAGLRSALGRV